MNATSVTYVSEDPSRAYAKAISACGTLVELVAELRRWRGLADDALHAAEQMKANEWDGFQRGLKAERRKKFAGDAWAEKWGVILMPERMIRASMLAENMSVPWGLAFLRLREVAL